MSDTPLRIAHQHAANADDAQAQGQLVRAAEEHQKASDAYALAGERATDEQVKKTLKMLQDDHSRSARDLERRINKLREEGKDPNVPQPSTPPKGSSKSRSTDSTSAHAGPGAGGAVDISQPTSPQKPLIDPHNEVDESFMLLAGTRSDPGDLFNQFWNVTQGMLDHLSQPVAFATAPLTSELETGPNGSGAKSPVSLTRRLPREGSISSDTDLEEPAVSWVSKKLGMGAGGTKKSGYPPPSSLSKHVFDDEFEEEFDPDDLSESFCLVTSGSENSSKLKKENSALKAELEATQKKLANVERVLHIREERDQQLKDSIVFARREAQRGRMNASTVAQRPTMPGGLDLGALNLNVPPPMANVNPGREAQYSRRIRELEDELRAVKAELKNSQAENEKQKAMIVKYKERWDKLKESSKKKKEARAASVNADLTKEKIVEEPAEVQLA